jgi:hypothetical protein
VPSLRFLSQQARRVYPQSGPDKREEHLRLFSALLSHDDIEGAWADRYAEIALAGQAKLANLGMRFDAFRPKIEERKPAEVVPLTGRVWINGRPYPKDVWEEHQRKLAAKKAAPKEADTSNAAQSFFVPASQPPADAEPEDKPKEPEPELAPQALVPVGFAPLPNDDVLELDPAAPFDNAQKIVSLRAWHAEEGMRTWHYWQQSFWQWAPFPQSEITNLVSSARVGPLVS